jgi:DNA-binding NtrC family response regulator
VSKAPVLGGRSRVPSGTAGVWEMEKMEKMQIMLVDDEDRFLLTTSKLLARKGYRVVTATSGAEALRKLKEVTVHVVVLDVKMPGMDGITTLKEIKKRFPDAEVILLTGHATLETAVEGLNAGACDYLMKPCNLDELIRKAEEVFEKRRHLTGDSGAG